MKFARIKQHSEYNWWLWNTETMMLINLNGGGFTIDENSDYWANAVIKEFDSWHHLYTVEKWNPLLGSIHDYDVWIDPEGNYYEVESHAVDAVKIVEFIYGVTFDPVFDYEDAEEYLIEHNWFKATRSAMWKYYSTSDTIWARRMTSKTKKAILNYCVENHLQIPSQLK